ncbi:VanZ family protein [Helcobacillus sp. ACRRO]|uniref:VanZ family protein n=1 Tax=Helcobacillus sp. ACRRO TaxID=2918202 RepID=UPI001EF4077D|nr:VanZ family protein [Helcobacillus sp. ACRRO]MCG7426687.1 VanZ family protein [Helcobacillus sp. ACRRO]
MPAAHRLIAARALLVAVVLLLNSTFYWPKLTPEAEAAGALIPHADKLVHTGIFALTVWTVLHLLAPRPAARFAVAAIGAHAFVIEAVQSLMPLRSFDLADIVADLVGVAAGAAVWALLRRRGAAGRRVPERTGR